jgi:AraC-like DNA-binding protein
MEYLLVIGSVHALFTATFLGTKRHRTLNDKFLAVWMVFLAMPLIAGASVQLWPTVHIPFLRADLIYPLTYGPFLWLYVGALTGTIEKISARHLVHFAPFAALSIFQLLSGWAPAPPNPNSGSFNTVIRVIGGVSFVVLATYATAVLGKLRGHDEKVLAHFSNLPDYVTLGWVRWMTVGMSGVFLLLFVAAVLSKPELMLVHLISLIVAIVVLSFFGLQQGPVFSTPDENVQPPDASEREKAGPRYDRSGLNADRADIITKRLDKLMASERPYLNADLTITLLAQRMAVPRHHLTEVINARQQKNFFQFINDYRIQAVKQALADPENAQQTLLDIAYASGFNSKSSFNTSFKQLTGQTPSQYRRQLT